MPGRNAAMAGAHRHESGFNREPGCGKCRRGWPAERSMDAPAHARLAAGARETDRWKMRDGQSGGPGSGTSAVGVPGVSNRDGQRADRRRRDLPFDAGANYFSPGERVRRVYLMVQGHLLRRSDRLETRITLGMARPGDLVELSAALGEPRHTFSLVAQTPGLLMRLPLEALRRAFESYPPLAHAPAGGTGARGIACLHIVRPGMVGAQPARRSPYAGGLEASISEQLKQERVTNGTGVAPGRPA